MKPADPERFRRILTGGGREDDPSAEQTDDQVRDYYMNAKAGDAAAIRQTQFHTLIFTITEIDRINEKIGRLYVKQGATWGGAAYYRKTGKRCFAPTGQTTLVIPTDDVKEFAAMHPHGKL